MRLKILSKPFDEEEAEEIKAIEAAELHPRRLSPQEMADLKASAREWLRKNKTVSLRLPEQDIQKIKEKAVQTGIPYQTLVGALIHQYAEGKIQIQL